MEEREDSFDLKPQDRGPQTPNNELRDAKMLPRELRNTRENSLWPGEPMVCSVRSMLYDMGESKREQRRADTVPQTPPPAFNLYDIRLSSHAIRRTQIHINTAFSQRVDEQRNNGQHRGNKDEKEKR